MSHDHRSLIAQYDLGHIEEHSPGLIHWHPNGLHVIEKLKQYMRHLHSEHSYEEVSSPILLSQSLWEKSGHWEKYRKGMFVAQSDEKEGLYAVKPMSCPGQINIYQHKRRSYKELPLKYFEFGHVHRNEPSGSLNGWLRLRGFIQDDSHIFLKQDQLLECVEHFVKMVEKAYSHFGFSKWHWKISLRPEQRAGSDDIWDAAEDQLREVCQQLNLDVIEAPGEGAFYGPKLEAVLEDSLGRQWQCGVVQVDFVLPKRFDLSYRDEHDEKQQPILVHHAVLGSLERWLSIVLEHHGRLPDWLSPHPIALCPIGDNQKVNVQQQAHQLRQKGYRVLVCEDGPLGGRIRHLSEQKVPIILVVGQKEIDENRWAWRYEGNQFSGNENDWNDFLSDKLS